jgi:ABC-type multidrug transport system ATPase subunit
MSEPLITLIDGRKVYRHSAVLTFPQVEISHGLFLGIYGDNASGKSTLLKILARITRLSSGILIWATSLRGKRIVFVPQSGGLYVNLTVEENICLYARLYDCAPALAEPIFEALGLNRSKKQPVRTLSGGYQKLAAIACALGVDPHGIFADEPFNGLDEDHRSVVLRLFEALKNRVEFLVGTDHDVPEVGLFSSQLTLTKPATQ